MANTMHVLSEVLQERMLQDRAFSEVNSKLTLLDFFVVLSGEVGEAAISEDLMEIRRELIQVAAVAVAMVEALDRGQFETLVAPTDKKQLQAGLQLCDQLEALEMAARSYMQQYHGLF